MLKHCKCKIEQGSDGWMCSKSTLPWISNSPWKNSGNTLLRSKDVSEIICCRTAGSTSKRNPTKNCLLNPLRASSRCWTSLFETRAGSAGKLAPTRNFLAPWSSAETPAETSWVPKENLNFRWPFLICCMTSSWEAGRANRTTMFGKRRWGTISRSATEAGQSQKSNTIEFNFCEKWRKFMIYNVKNQSKKYEFQEGFFVEAFLAKI